jgi:Protein of unknown function (DUF2934)
MRPLKSSTVVPEPTESEIQHAAYLLWLENGRPEGRDLDHWFAARELLRHHHGRSAAPRRRAPARAAAGVPSSN